MRIILTQHAVTDIAEARDHYAAIAPHLSLRFVEDIDAAFERMTMFPRGAPPVEGFDELRRARMRQFPYGIFYQVANDLLVVRVLHTRRHHPDAISAGQSP
nr:type II toxin-antitoxin system RelE/ParE family toxin [Ornithinimicrobium sp. HY1745]